MSNSGLFMAAPIRRKKSPAYKIHVVSTHRSIKTNCVSGRMLQPSTEPVIANFSVPSDFLVEDLVSGLGTEHPISL